MNHIGDNICLVFCGGLKMLCWVSLIKCFVLQRSRLMVSLARQCSHTDWQVFNMSLPLRAHLEKLDSVPFLTVDCNLQWVVFRHTDQPADAVNTLELGVRVSGLVLLLPNL